MAYDLALLADQCSKLGWYATTPSAGRLAIALDSGTTLLFVNDVGDDGDNSVGFDGYGWHTHGGPIFSDSRGFYVELEYTDILPGLADKTLLICELWQRGKLSDRWLIHRDYVSDLNYMQDGDEVRIRPVHTSSTSA
jgi:hypothetical protein